MSMRGKGVRVWFLNFLNLSSLLETQVEMSRNHVIPEDRSLEFRGEFEAGTADLENISV